MLIQLNMMKYVLLFVLCNLILVFSVFRLAPPIFSLPGLVGVVVGKSTRACTIFMGCSDRIQAECSLHDSDIVNMNRVFLQSAALVAKDCNDLGISFSDPDEEVLSSATRILNKH